MTTSIRKELWMTFSLMPPSNVVCLPHMSGPFDPAFSLDTKAAPLSDVNITRVSLLLNVNFISNLLNLAFLLTSGK